MDTTAAAKLIGMVVVLWPTYKPADVKATVGAWALVLDGIDLEDAQAAVVLIAQRGDHFPPAPGEIRQAVLTRTEPDTTPDPDEAWAEVMTGIRRWGYVRSFEERTWSHPAVTAAVEAFGWLELCKVENLDVARAQFRGFYDHARRRHAPDRISPAITQRLSPSLEPSRLVEIPGPSA